MFEQTEIDIFGFLLREPMTTLTDLITASICFISFYKLTSQTQQGYIQTLLRYYFLFMGLATLNAAFFSHGILYLVTPNWKVIGWSCSSIAILLLELGSIEYGKSWLGSTRSRYLRILAFLQLAGFFGLMLFPETRNFNMVKLNSTIGLAFFSLPIHALSWRKGGSEGSRTICLAIVYGILPAIVYNSEFTIHKYFNYHDISHVLMSIFIAIMYFGVKRLILDLKTFQINEPSTITT